MTLPEARTEAALSLVFTEHWGRLVAGLIRLTGDWDLAEESVQDAFTHALEHWPRSGIPRNPAAGLALIDRLAAGRTLDGYHLLPAVRADLLRRMGRRDEAHATYRQALALTGTDAERRYLEGRIRETRGEEGS